MDLGRTVGRSLGVAWIALFAQAPLFAQQTVRVSVDGAGVEGTGASRSPATSADGRVVAFASDAPNLVAGDNNGVSDVFVVDRTTGLIERVSIDSSGVEGNGGSFTPALSSDGQIVAFQSFATNLVTNDTNAHADIFVHDRATGGTTRVSVVCKCVQGDGDASSPALSADGQQVAFATDNTQLIGGDTNGVRDVFVHDRTTGLSRRVSLDSAGVQANGASDTPSISADGLRVAFVSQASNLVAADANALADIFVHDRSAAVTERVSLDRSGSDANGASESPSISGDGLFIAFASFATDLVASDTNGCRDLFVRDRVAATTARVSVDSSGVEGALDSFAPSISADGAVVAFSSSAANLVANDSNGVDDLFVHERASGITERVSVDSLGAQANGASATAVIAPDGLAVAFASAATNLVTGDANGVDDLFVRDRCVLASATSYGAGFPGALGVPALVARTLPVSGTTLDVDVGSSATTTTLAIVLVGNTAASIPLKKGGDLLVLPILAIPVTLPVGGVTLSEDLDDDVALCGLEFFVQSLIVDPGAAKGQSASAGLQLVVGH